MRNEEIKIGLLEFGVSDQKNSMYGLEDIFSYATAADEIGFSRFWISEHHRSNSLHPYNNPEILISLIAGMTNTIRVGSAGSLIGYYSPYSLVQNYKLLNNIFNDRIDFGLSKGRPEHSHLHNYFNTNNPSFNNKDYRNNLEGICDLLQNEEENYEKRNIIIPPYKGLSPALWYLSNSYRLREMAVEKKLNICKSLMHGLDVFDFDPEVEELRKYREAFFNTHNEMPEVALAIAVTFTDSPEIVKEKESKIINIKEAIKTLAVSEENFLETLENLQKKYEVDEFIIYDTEKNLDKKIENLKLMKELTSQKILKVY